MKSRGASSMTRPKCAVDDFAIPINNSTVEPIGLEVSLKPNLGLGEMLSLPMLSSALAKDGKRKDIEVLSMDTPRIIAPNRLNSNDDYLLWVTVRDTKVDNSIAPYTSGRIVFATSKDGLNNWKFHEDNPIIDPGKDNGDWFYFDAEHIGLGDVVMPGDSAQSKFNTQSGVYLMYTFGGRNEKSAFCQSAEPVEGDSTKMDVKLCSEEEFEGMDNTKGIKGLRMEIGVYVSQDAAHWSRVEGPTAFGSIIEKGQLLRDVNKNIAKKKTDTDEWDHIYAGWPCVVEDVGKEYKMYYHSYDPSIDKNVVGLAVARDGLMTWKKRGPVFVGCPEYSDAFDYKGVTKRCVLKLDDATYRMWYEALDINNKHSIGCANSDDGINWTRVSDKPVFESTSTMEGDSNETSWDHAGVGSPHLIYLSNKKRWRMYYMGYSGKSNESDYLPDADVSTKAFYAADGSFFGTEGKLPMACIGVAESVDEEGYIFERLQL